MPAKISLVAVVYLVIGACLTAPLAAQTAQSDQLRADIHDRLRAGHLAIPYSLTDEAMACEPACKIGSDSVLVQLRPLSDQGA